MLAELIRIESVEPIATRDLWIALGVIGAAVFFVVLAGLGYFTPGGSGGSDNAGSADD